VPVFDYFAVIIVIEVTVN